MEMNADNYAVVMTKSAKKVAEGIDAGNPGICEHVTGEATERRSTDATLVAQVDTPDFSAYEDYDMMQFWAKEVEATGDVEYVEPPIINHECMLDYPDDFKKGGKSQKTKAPALNERADGAGLTRKEAKEQALRRLRRNIIKNDAVLKCPLCEDKMVYLLLRSSVHSDDFSVSWKCIRAFNEKDGCTFPTGYTCKVFNFSRTPEQIEKRIIPRPQLEFLDREFRFLYPMFFRPIITRPLFKKKPASSSAPQQQKELLYFLIDKRRIGDDVLLRCPLCSSDMMTIQGPTDAEGKTRHGWFCSKILNEENSCNFPIFATTEAFWVEQTPSQQRDGFVPRPRLELLEQKFRYLYPSVFGPKPKKPTATEQPYASTAPATETPAESQTSAAPEPLHAPRLQRPNSPHEEGEIQQDDDPIVRLLSNFTQTYIKAERKAVALKKRFEADAKDLQKAASTATKKIVIAEKKEARAATIAAKEHHHTGELPDVVIIEDHEERAAMPQQTKHQAKPPEVIVLDDDTDDDAKHAQKTIENLPKSNVPKTSTSLSEPALDGAAAAPYFELVSSFVKSRLNNETPSILQDRNPTGSMAAKEYHETKNVYKKKLLTDLEAQMEKQRELIQKHYTEKAKREELELKSATQEALDKDNFERQTLLEVDQLVKRKEIEVNQRRTTAVKARGVFSAPALNAPESTTTAAAGPSSATETDDLYNISVTELNEWANAESNEPQSEWAAILREASPPPQNFNPEFFDDF